MNPYLCLHCNALTRSDEHEALIQCQCGEAAWRIRCFCHGYIVGDQCERCGLHRNI